MKTDPRADAVAQQYRDWQYPEPIEDLDAWLVDNWQWFDPRHAHGLFWPDRPYPAQLDILVAGCGTNQAAVIAYTNPTAKVVAIDVSEPSLDHHRHLQQKYALSNLELHCLPIEEASSLQRDFDLVISTGVLHHMADPQRGLEALAQCLRPEGVAAIMVYAQYGRTGVEMLKTAFQELGLHQDDASLAVVKAALDALPKDHPLKSYMALAPDLEFDAGLIDTFLHGRDRNYSVNDCLELVASSGLVFQDWFFKAPYYPQTTENDPFIAAVKALPIERQWSVMERINHRNGCHFFTACRPDRPPETYRIDFAKGSWLDLVPTFRHRCALQGGELSRPGWRRTLNDQELPFVQLIDGQRTTRQIVSTLAGQRSIPDKSASEIQCLGLDVFKQLWESDFLAMRLAGHSASDTGLSTRIEPTDRARHRPRICLNMIVRNESHIIKELIEAVSGLIDTWVIVDTGSDDGTPDLIRSLMAERGIPGELHHRPWRDFGHNRTEALALAQGHADYIWVMDADDAIVGTPDFNGLTLDAYSMRFKHGTLYWRKQLFRNGVPWRYEGVLHEAAVCDQPASEDRLQGDYAIASRRLGARSRDPEKYARDAEILQSEVDRNPTNARAVFYLAQSYRDAGHPAQAWTWYGRRAEMGGWEEEVYCALYEQGHCADQLGRPWAEVQDAYLKAWEYRPTRAEPLHAIARRSRENGRYLVGLMFAQQASRIPLPEDDTLFVDASVYEWRALDEFAVCASWLGLWAQTLELCEQILGRDDIPLQDRQRIADNRDQARQQVGSSGIHDFRTADERLRPALLSRLLRRAVASGQVRLPAVPAMLDDYQALCERTFETLGVDFSPAQRDALRTALSDQLAKAWAASPRSEILISYESPIGLRVQYEIKPQWSSLGEAYNHWVSTREPPYFGSHPDAKVMALAAQAKNSGHLAVLDVGAGTGRNALALARSGHPVDAVELSAEFASILQGDAKKESLPLRVIQRSVFDTADDLRSDYGLVLASEVVTDFRSVAELRRFLEMASDHLSAGGHLLFNIFLAQDDYEPDAAARQLGQQLYTSIFTKAELATALSNLPLTLISDESVLSYEKKNLPQGAWPPTSWYADWVSGLDLFETDRADSPVELRWLVYRR